MNGAKPIRPRRESRTGTHGEHRLRRILGATVPSDHPVSALTDLPPAHNDDLTPFPAISYLDTMIATPTSSSAGDTAIHVLWTAATTGATIRLGSTEDEAIDLTCVAGDFLRIPSSTPFSLGPGMLAVQIATQPVEPITGTAAWSPPQPIPAPTHGLPVFSGFNRQTFGIATRDMVCCRWKLTQPLRLSAPSTGPIWLSNLVAPVAISWLGGADLLGRTESVLVPPGCDLTVVPNDLGYILTAWRPDVARDVLPPLRSAGYTNAEIATLGVPAELLARASLQ